MRRRLFVTAVIGFCGIAALAYWWRVHPISEDSIPVVWTASETPAVEAMIEGKPCFLTLSSASKYFLSLDENGVAFLTDKTPCGITTWRDPKGNSYESPSLHVKKVRVGSLEFLDVIAQGIYKKDAQNTILWESPNYKKDDWPETSGSLGRPFLAKTNLLLDLGHDRIIVANCKDSLKKYGVDLDAMKKIPLEPDERGIIVKINTGIGPLRFDINTAATTSVVRPSLVLATDYAARLRKDQRGLTYFVTDFVVGATTIGRHEDIYLLEMSDEMTWMDGYLGVDFLKQHVVYIDYQDKTVYIS